MSFINLSNLTFSYENSINPIFSSINHTFNNGWHALIGPNGCGKSTLLQLLSKNIIQQEGLITPTNINLFMQARQPSIYPRKFL